MKKIITYSLFLLISGSGLSQQNDVKLIAAQIFIKTVAANIEVDTASIANITTELFWVSALCRNRKVESFNIYSKEGASLKIEIHNSLKKAFDKYRFKDSFPSQIVFSILISNPLSAFHTDEYRYAIAETKKQLAFDSNEIWQLGSIIYVKFPRVDPGVPYGQ
jgi:hypothetical protein